LIGYVPTREAIKILHVTGATLRNWNIEGKIDAIRKGGEHSHRYYNVRKFFAERGIEAKPTPPTRRKICYCRVSSRGQIDDLGRQKTFLQEKYPSHEIIKDIGSGLNFKRKGLKTILEYACGGEIEELVVAHKDRLCRFGFEMFEFIITRFSNGKITVLGDRTCSKNEELVSDILSIITVFSARVNGLRKYRTSIQSDLGTDNKTEEKTEEETETDPRGIPSPNDEIPSPSNVETEECT